MFISNNRASFHLWWKENLVKHQKVLKYFENDQRTLNSPIRINEHWENINHKVAILNEFITKKISATVSCLPEILRLRTASTPNYNNVKLPNFDIKVFSGKDPTEGSSFYESFLEAIHKNQSFVDIEKWIIWQSDLSNEALMTVKGLNFNLKLDLDLNLNLQT